MSKIHDDLRQAEMDRQTQTSASRIGAGLRIKGEVSGNEDLVIEGNVEGPVHVADGKLTVESKGNVLGNVTSREAVVLGTIQGNLQVRDRLEIRARGSVIGDATTGRIVVEDGAYFKGGIEIGTKEGSSSAKTAPAESSSAAAASGRRAF